MALSSLAFTHEQQPWSPPLQYDPRKLSQSMYDEHFLHGFGVGFRVIGVGNLVGGLILMLQRGPWYCLVQVHV